MLNLPNYQILETIYEGTTSIIYRALKKEDNQTVILKMLKKEYPTPAELTRFQQSYEINRELDFAGVLKAYNIEKYRNTLVMVLEEFGDDSLQNVILSFGNRGTSIADFFLLAIQLAEGLSNIHTANIIHKDINPTNIIIDLKSKQLKMIDFGIASRLPREKPTLKNPEHLEGTLAYLSPEQTGRVNRRIDYRTDLYSLGVTFYEMLTGELPFKSTEALELVHCHIAKIPPPVSNPQVPKILCDIVMKLMAKNASDRYQSAFGVKSDLEKCQIQWETTGTIEAFELAQNDFSGRFQIPQKLYGREKEIEKLLQAFERVSAGAVEMMLVTGYSGVGKSALVYEVHNPMTEKRGYFAAGKFDQIQRDIPYSALTQAFNQFCDYILTESTEQLNQWQEQILAAVGENGKVLIEVIPNLERVIGDQPTVTEVGTQETQNRFNLVFQNFMRVITQHPMVLFIDDLQWADLASLTLLKNLMRDDQHLLLICAYRDNEVNVDHPFMMVVDSLKKEGVTVNTIHLENLSRSDVNRLIAKALACEPKQADSLTDLVYEKTQGNAFFTHEFLKSLYVEGLLVFDLNKRQWQWEIDKIAAKDMTDNVVELMVGKIEKLPQSMKTILKLAACIGNTFDLLTLSIIAQDQETDIIPPLQKVIEEGLLLPIDYYDFLDIEENGETRFQFSHNRIQQAAYSLIPETDKTNIHLQIGRCLSPNSIFEIVDHLNLGTSQVTEKREKLGIAQLNLLAGHKAKATTAYKQAFDYAQKGIALLHEEAWEENYIFSLQLYSFAIESAYLISSFEQMDKLAKKVLQQAKTILDKVKIYEIHIQACISKGEQSEAVNHALILLKLLEIKLPDSPNKLNILVELLKTKWALRKKSIKSLVDLPEMTQPDKLAAMSTLNRMASAAYQSAPDLFPLTVFKRVMLSVKYGNSPESIFGYSNYGIVLCGTGEIEQGYQFGHLSLELLSQLNAKEFKAKTYFVFNVFIRHWKLHARKTIDSLLEAYQIGMDTGDLEYASYAAVICLYHLFFLGEELPKIKQYINTYRGAITHQQMSLNYLNILDQTLINLTTLALDEREVLNGEAYQERKMLSIHRQANDKLAIFSIYLYKLILGYLFDAHDEALEHATIAFEHIDAATAMFVVPQFYFYDSLNCLALYPNLSKRQQLSLRFRVSNNQRKMKKWAKQAPMNHLHKYHLVEAERCRILNKTQKAKGLYEQAVQGAIENGYLHEEALAYELGAKFFIACGMEKLAQNYLRKAYTAYRQRGTLAKTKALEEKYAQWLKDSEASSVTTTMMASQTTSTLLDLDSVMNAAQTLSGEIVLNRLLEKLMHAVIENAGAERGLLILEKGKADWVIEAEGAFNVDEISVLQSLPLEGHLPTALVNYVLRAREPVVLSNAMSEGVYSKDHYIREHHTKSVLCSPIIHQTQLVGLLYLENNVTEGAFTPARLKVLDMLSSQAAISLQNARLYQTLEQKVEERTAQLNAKIEELLQTRNELVQSEKMASLGRLVAGFAHELNTPIGVAVGAASHLQERSYFLNRLLEQEEVDEEELVSALDTVDEAATLTLSNLKRAAELVKSFKRTAVDQTSEERMKFEIKTTIEDIVRTLHNKFKSTAIEIQLDCPNALIIYSIPGTIGQLITNLMMNSLIHGFEEGKKGGVIKIIVRLKNKRLHIDYSDTGKGITPEALEKIFEPFFTTRRAKGGSGLGMYICYNLVKSQLNGTMSCKSTLGEGVLFRIEFPV